MTGAGHHCAVPQLGQNRSPDGIDRPQFRQARHGPGGGAGCGGIIIGGAGGRSCITAPATAIAMPTTKTPVIPYAIVRYVEAVDTRG